MRQLRRTTPFLLLLLLLALLLTLHCADGGLAAAAPPALKHRCMFDEMMQKRSGMLPTVVVREVPRKGQGAMQAYTVATTDDKDDSVWKPIRFKVFTGALNDSNKYCNQTGVARTNFRNKNLVCDYADILTESKKTIYQNVIIPRAIKLHAERLLVKPVSGNLVLPGSLPFPCSLFSIPEDHRSAGVADADMVLYAASGPMERGVAWAVTCAKLNDGRPSVGVMNYNPQQIVAKELAFRILAHEIAHALGFAYSAMDSKGILSLKYGVRGKTHVRIVSGNNTRTMARAHFGCEEIAGMELEDSESSHPGFHWNLRLALNELMAPVVRTGRYTALTMAAFVDLGYYRANWSMAEPMSWGNNTGCDFLQKRCEDDKNFTNKYPNMFCNADDGKMLRCTSDRHYVGSCTNVTFDWRKGPSDTCPVVASFFDRGHEGTDFVLGNCSDASVKFLPGSLVGSNSWCLDADLLVVKATAEGKEEDSSEYGPVGGVCAEVSCEFGELKVKYLGSDSWHACKEGDEIQVSPSAYFKEGGRIKCPKYTEVCTMAANGSGLLAPIPPDLQKEEEMDDDTLLQVQHLKNKQVKPEHVITPGFSHVVGRGDGSVTAVAGFSSLLLLFAMATTTAVTVMLL